MQFLRFLILVKVFLLHPAYALVSNDTAGQALDEARKFEQAGEYSKSLERYEWFHDNALKIKSSYYGVRLSYALIEWVELGKKYPPALDSLKKLRDRKTNLIIDGTHNFEIFHEVIAVNRYLDEKWRSIELFKALDSKISAFAMECFSAFDDELLEAKEFILFSRYAGDLKIYLSKKISEYEEMKILLKGDRNSDQGIKQLGVKLVDLTLTLCTLVRDKGHEVLASELRSLTFKSVPDSRLLIEK